MYDVRTGVGGPPATMPGSFLYDPLQDRNQQQQQQMPQPQQQQLNNLAEQNTTTPNSHNTYINSASFLRTTTSPQPVTNTPPQEINRQDIYSERPPFFAESNQRYPDSIPQGSYPYPPSQRWSSPPQPMHHYTQTTHEKGDREYWEEVTPRHESQELTTQHPAYHAYGNPHLAPNYDDPFTSNLWKQHVQNTNFTSWKIPREDRHLGVMAPQMQMVSYYKDFLWTFCPLHPAVFDESNIFSYLSSNEGSDDMSSLSLGISLALCLTAAVKGNEKAQREYEGKVRQQLAYLRQYPDLINDFSVAMAAYVLSNYYLFWKLSIAESNTFRQLAMNICRSLNAVNSIVYSRCLYAMSAQLGASFENMQHLKNELQRSKQQPYFTITSTTSNGYPPKYSMTTSLPISPENLPICTDVILTAGSVIAGIRLYRENVRMSVYPAKRTAVTGPILEELLNAMQSWEKEMAARFKELSDMNELPKGSLYYCNLLVLAIYMQYYLVAGEWDVAQKYGSEFLKVCRGYGEDLVCIAGGSPFILEIALGVFWELKRFDLVQELIDTVQSWARAQPIIARLTAGYVQRLAENLPEINTTNNNHNGHNNGMKEFRGQPRTTQLQQTVIEEERIESRGVGGSPSSDMPPFHAPRGGYGMTTTQWHRHPVPPFSQQQHLPQHLQPQQKQPFSSSSIYDVEGNSSPPSDSPSSSFSGPPPPSHHPHPFPSPSSSSASALLSADVEEIAPPKRIRRKAPRRKQFFVLGEADFANTKPKVRRRPRRNANKPEETETQEKEKEKEKENAEKEKEKEKEVIEVRELEDKDKGKEKAQTTQQYYQQQQPQQQQQQLQQIVNVDEKQQQTETAAKGQELARTTKKRKLSDSPTPESDKQKIKTEEAHLALVSECYRYLAVYRKSLWHFFPLHPTVLDESNVEYFLVNEDGGNEISPLAMSFYMGLCKGSMACGHMKWSIDFFNRADGILQRLLEYPEYKNDFSIASAVIVMAWQVALMEHRTEMMDTYTQIAFNICHTLSAFHSDVFVKYLFLLTTFPHTIEERDKLLTTIRGLKRYAYTPVSTSVPSPAFSAFPNVPPSAIPPPPQIGTPTARPMSQLQQRMPVSQRNMQHLVSAYMLWAQISAGITLHDELLCEETLTPVLGNIIEFENLLEDIRRQQQQSQDPWPGSVNKLHTLFIAAMRARYYFYLGDRNNAIAYAIHTLGLAEKRKCRLFSASLSTVMTVLADIFFKWHEDALLKRQLTLMDTWTAIPILENLRLRFLQKLLRQDEGSSRGTL